MFLKDWRVFKKKPYKTAYIQGKCVSVILFRLQCLPSYTSKCLSYWYNYIFMVNMIICTIHLKHLFESSLNCSRISTKNTLDELRSLAWLGSEWVWSQTCVGIWAILRDNWERSPWVKQIFEDLAHGKSALYSTWSQEEFFSFDLGLRFNTKFEKINV